MNVHGMRRTLKQQWLYARALLQHGQLDAVEHLVFADRKLAFLVVSKVACTSIKRAIGAAYGIDGPDIHAADGWVRRWGRLKGVEAEYFSFAFVRDPFARLVSCYRDKILWEPTSRVYPTPYFDVYPFRMPTNMPFPEFVRRVVRIPDRLADRHFKSQHAHLYVRGARLVQFVGRIERLAEDWRTIAERFDFQRTLGRSHATAPSDEDYRAWYTPALVDTVYARYREDFETLGYAGAREELLGFLR